ncbi:multidrug efflux ABC transporter permease LieB [Georgenia halophila]|uniref:Transport permease protein n=1 Tax=Georgenia halophila TaxID=620889 RepID=A0ABP8LI90_9MICO
MSATALAAPAPVAPVRRRPGDAIADVALFTRRGIRHQLRSLDALLLNVLLPVLLMTMFVYVFGGALSTGGSGLDYVDYVVPGVVLLTAGYGAANTAQSVAGDMVTGIVDRFRSLPVADWAVPAGHVVASVAKNLVTTAIVLAVAFAVGFRPDAGLVDWLGVVALVVLYVLAMTWLATVVGLVAGSVESASAFSFFVLFLPYLSSAFVPVETMPTVLRAFAEHQPITPLTDSLRGLLLDMPIGDNGWIAVLWCVGIMLVAAPLSAMLFRRRAGR